MSMRISARHHTKPPTLIGHDEDTWSITVATRDGSTFEIVEQMDGRITVTAQSYISSKLAIYPRGTNSAILQDVKP